MQTIEMNASFHKVGGLSEPLTVDPGPIPNSYSAPSLSGHVERFFVHQVERFFVHQKVGCP